MKTINKREFDELVIEEGESAVVVFARKTCSICASVKNILSTLEEEYSAVKFYIIDSEEEINLMVTYHIKGVPQVLLFNKGKEEVRIVGMHDIDEYANVIETLVK